MLKEYPLVPLVIAEMRIVNDNQKISILIAYQSIGYVDKLLMIRPTNIGKEKSMMIDPNKETTPTKRSIF